MAVCVPCSPNKYDSITLVDTGSDTCWQCNMSAWRRLWAAALPPRQLPDFRFTPQPSLMALKILCSNLCRHLVGVWNCKWGQVWIEPQPEPLHGYKGVGMLVLCHYFHPHPQSCHNTCLSIKPESMPKHVLSLFILIVKQNWCVCFCAHRANNDKYWPVKLLLACIITSPAQQVARWAMCDVELMISTSTVTDCGQLKGIFNWKKLYSVWKVLL